MLARAALLVVMLTAHAASADSLADGLQAFKKTYFEEAIPLLREALADTTIAEKDRREAHLALAQSLYFTDQHAAAKHQLQQLLKESPSSKPSAAMSPEFQEFFAAVRDEIAKAAPSAPVVKKKPPSLPPPPTTSRVEPAPARIPDAPPVPAAEPVRAAEPVPAPAPTVQAAPPTVGYQPAPWYLKVIPFGVGQFCNRDPIGGSVFLGLELAAVGANVGLSIVNATKRLPNGNYPANAGYPGLYIAQHVTAATAWAIGIVGVIDAFVWSPGRGEARAAASQEVLVPVTGGGLATWSGSW